MLTNVCTSAVTLSNEKKVGVEKKLNWTQQLLFLDWQSPNRHFKQILFEYFHFVSRSGLPDGLFSNQKSKFG
jgi:hypothetical protein